MHMKFFHKTVDYNIFFCDVHNFLEKMKTIKFHACLCFKKLQAKANAHVHMGKYS